MRDADVRPGSPEQRAGRGQQLEKFIWIGALVWWLDPLVSCPSNPNQKASTHFETTDPCHGNKQQMPWGSLHSRLATGPLLKPVNCACTCLASLSLSASILSKRHCWPPCSQLGRLAKKIDKDWCRISEGFTIGVLHGLPCNEGSLARSAAKRRCLPQSGSERLIVVVELR